mmetsp:Transcript_21404/g.59349  ORF Transcript_21404/g.59349 Transcript_21404/m.59349 type:complete len:266 (+) Transcript_21404:126-923(+)
MSCKHLHALLLLMGALAIQCEGLVVNADLTKLAEQVCGTSLDFKVAFGSKETPFQMKDMHVVLGSTKRTPKPLSTGIHEADLLKRPYFVNEKGEQRVELTGGGWEITWDKSPHGILTCSFISPQTVQRNEASMEAGRFFLRHRVWTQESLESERSRRRKIQNEAAKSIKTRDQKIKEMTNEEGTMGSKVVSYAKAAQAMGDYYKSGYQEALFIPLYDSQVLELAPDCIVSTRGQIYQQLSRRKPEYVGESRVDFLQTNEESVERP